MANPNRGSIVDEASELIGNTSIDTRLNAWLNHILDYIHRTQPWMQLIRRATGSLTASTATLAWPSDFRASHPNDVRGVVLKRSAETSWRTPLTYLDLDRYWMLSDRDSAAKTGEPTHYTIDFYNSQLRFYPVPNVAYNYELIYYYLPSDISADGTTPALPIGPILVRVLVEYAAFYEQDSRFALLDGLVDKWMRPMRVAHLQRPSGGNVIKLDPTVFLMPGGTSSWPDETSP